VFRSVDLARVSHAVAVTTRNTSRRSDKALTSVCTQDKSNAGVKNGVCKYQMQGMLQYHCWKRLCNSKLGRPSVCVCVLAVADVQYNAKGVV
jgi:hypothetical protein